MNPIENNSSEPTNTPIQPTPPQPAVYNYQGNQQSTGQPAPGQLPHHPDGQQQPAPVRSKLDGPIDKLGGWLLVLAVVLGVGAFLNLRSLIDINKTMSDSLVQSIYSSYPGLESALGFERIVFILAVLAAVVSIVLLIMRKKVAKPFIIVFLLAIVATSVADVIVVNHIFKSNPLALEAVKDNSQITRSLIAAAVWIPYLVRSVRVKHTLTK